MSADDYNALRAEVLKHLATVTRAWLGREMTAGRLRLATFDRWSRFYTDMDAIDAAIEHAEAYAHCVVCPLYALDLAAVESTPGLPDYLHMVALNTQAQNEAASAFWDAVAGRFDEVRSVHAEQLAARSAALMARLEREASTTSASELELWARYGMSLDARRERVLSTPSAVDLT